MAEQAAQPGSSRPELSLSQSLSPSRCSRAVLSPSTGKPCLVCFDRERDGIECEGGGHFICRTCLQGFIQSLDAVHIRRSGGLVSCPGIDGEYPCEASPWSYDDLADLLDIKTQKLYVSKLSSVLVSVLSSASLQQQGSVAPSDPRMSMSMSRHHRRRSSQTQRWSLGRAGTRGVSLSLVPGEEATEAAALGEQEQQEKEQREEELRWHRQVIDDQILTLTCPREGCRRAFLDFDGCFALTCPGCACGFCAACVIDCGDDAHEHCRSVHHGYYGTFEAFLEVHRVRRLTAVAAYLHSLLLAPPAASPSAPLGSPIFPTRTPEQAGALVEALLTGPLALDLKEVGIDVEDVRRALASIKDGTPGAGPGTATVVPKLFGAGAAAEAAPAEAGEAAGGPAPIRLHYSHEQARRHYRRLLDGPGYPPEDDALSRWTGSCLTGSSMVAAVWWLTAAEGEAGRLPWVLAALVVGPAGVLLGTGRGRQVAQALWVTLLAGLLAGLLYAWGNEISAWTFFAFVKIGGVFLHALGFAADATMEGLRILRGLASLASLSHLAELAQRFKRALDVVGLLPPDDAAIPTAMA